MSTSSYIVEMHWRSKDSLFISGLFDNIYVNKFSHVSQDGIFRGDNVTLVIPDGNSIIRERKNILPIQCLLLLEKQLAFLGPTLDLYNS